MAARHPPHARSTSAASNPSNQQQQQQQQHPVRRTLFSGSLTRRPGPASAPASTEALTPHGQGPSSITSGSGFTPAPSFHHVARPADDDGATDDEDAQDEHARATNMQDDAILVPDSHAGGDGYGKKAAAEKELLVRFLEEAAAEAAAAGGEEADGGDAVGRDDSARLIEMYRSHARQRIDPNEVRPAVQETLLRQVASLQDDKWMYEAESDSEES